MKKLILLILVSCTWFQKPNIIKVPLKSEVSTLDPHLSYDLVSNLIVYQVYEPLYQYHYLKRPYSFTPLIAEGLPEISEDGLTYKIKIKKNIFYHQNDLSTPKREVTSQDFINSFKRLAFKGTESKGWWLLKNKIKGLDNFRNKAKSDLSNFFDLKVEGLKILDKYSFQIELTTAAPQLMHFLAMNFCVPIPKEAIIKTKNNLENYFIGTGPFIFNKIDKDKKITLIKNKDYSTSKYPKTGDRYSNKNNFLVDSGKKLPLNDGLEFHVISDDTKRWNSFIDKKVDFVDVPPDKTYSILTLDGKLKDLYKDKNINLEVSPSLIFWWLAFNMRDSVVGKNKYLRKAISHAIDIDRYIGNFYSNTGRKARSLYPPGVKGYNPSKKSPYTYNLKLARTYLEKAGYPKGKGLGVIEFNTRRPSEQHIKMAQFIKSELSKIGIVLKIVVNKFPEFLDKAKKRNMQFWQGGWLMDYPDPENIIQLLYSQNALSGPNKTGFQSKKLDKLFLQYLNSSSQDPEIENILKEIEDIVLDEIPWIITNYSIHYKVHHQHLKNFRYSDLIFNTYKYLRKK